MSLQSLTSGVRRCLPEVTRFAIVGLTNLVLDLVVFNALLFTVLPHKPVTAKVIAGVVSTLSSFWMSRRWTWRERGSGGPAGVQLAGFFLVSGVGLALASSCLVISHYVLELDSVLADNLSSNVVGLAVAMIWRFFALRRWVFPETGPVTLPHAVGSLSVVPSLTLTGLAEAVVPPLAPAEPAAQR